LALPRQQHAADARERDAAEAAEASGRRHITARIVPRNPTRPASGGTIVVSKSVADGGAGGGESEPVYVCLLE
jgi:hypothetical protein